MKRRSFLIASLATPLAGIFGKLFKSKQIERNELDAIDAIDYCADDGKISLVGMDNERSSMWRSDDGGLTFFEVETLPERTKKITALITLDSEFWYIGYDDGELWETHDAGATWKNCGYSITSGNLEGVCET